MTFSGSYSAEDVSILLKPCALATTDVVAKETAIQDGSRHYSEMISPEAIPDDRYMRMYEAALERNAPRMAADVAVLADRILERTPGSTTIVSLARAGTPVGVLLMREMRRRGVDAAHYSVSIIRGRGIDRVAMEHIASARGRRDAVFVDGWTGKGAIADELKASLAGTGFEPTLAVIADPAGRADLAATVDDYVIPSGILNGIVSGLISRSILNDEVVGRGDFHACLHQEHLAGHDRTMAFIAAIEAANPVRRGLDWTHGRASQIARDSRRIVTDIMRSHRVEDVNRIKPGIAEATRAILRRVPDAVLLRDVEDPDTEHVLHLARKAGVAIQFLPGWSPYRAVTIIRKLAE